MSGLNEQIFTLRATKLGCNPTHHANRTDPSILDLVCRKDLLEYSRILAINLAESLDRHIVKESLRRHLIIPYRTQNQPPKPKAKPMQSNYK